MQAQNLACFFSTITLLQESTIVLRHPVHLKAIVLARKLASHVFAMIPPWRVQIAPSRRQQVLHTGKLFSSQAHFQIIVLPILVRLLEHATVLPRDTTVSVKTGLSATRALVRLYTIRVCFADHNCLGVEISCSEASCMYGNCQMKAQGVNGVYTVTAGCLCHPAFTGPNCAKGFFRFMQFQNVMHTIFCILLYRVNRLIVMLKYTADYYCGILYTM